MTMINMGFSKKINLVCVVLCSLLGFTTMYAQDKDTEDKEKKERKWFVSLDYGVQMSGIKREDFVFSNYSPVYRLSVGKDFSPIWGMQIGYQGRYFRAISDNFRWTYDFVFVEAKLNVSNLFFNKNGEENYKLLLHAGPGYFYHHLYGRADIHGNLGASNHFDIGKNLELKIDLSAIVGWDIYQGDDDILPNLTAGLVYRFN